MATQTRPDHTDDIVPIDETVRHPLSRVRRRIRWYVLFEGMLLVGLFLTLWFWIGLLIDYGMFRATGVDWVQSAPWAARGVVLGAILAALASLLIVRVVRRLFREFTNRSIALVLERRFPQVLGDRLITAVDLADLKRAHGYGYSRDMILKTIEDARDRIERVPVERVFDYGRLRVQGLWLAGLSIGVAALAFLGGLIWAITREAPVERFTNQSRDVTLIWAERNLLLRDVPWPRDTYLEMASFDGDVKRIGKDDPSPRIEVVAWKWVIADETTPDGWRPLLYEDLPRVLDTDAPTLPIQQLRDTRDNLALSAALLGSSGNPLAPILGLQITPESLGLRLPADLPTNQAELDKWRVDRIELTLLQSREVRNFLSGQSPDAVLGLESMFERLAEKGTDPDLSREFRLLEPPSKVTLRYWNRKIDNTMELKPVGLTYSGTMVELRDSVKLRASANDYRTDVKEIELVPPPRLASLSRTEYRPAYLYHRPPEGTGPAGLRGLKQTFKGLNVSLTGSNSLFEIPQETELTLAGSADKDLHAARILPKAGAFPGTVEGRDAEPIDLNVGSDQRSFSFPFFGANRIIAPTEFEIELTDTDRVRSKRLIQIRPIEDFPPDVAVEIDVIRKVGNEYLCTPVALIPFVPESRITDQRGLNDVSYRFRYRRLESQNVLNTQATLVGGLMLGTPTMPNLGDLIFGPAYLSMFGPLMGETDPVIERSVTLDGFAALWAQRGRDDVDLQGLRQKLNQPVDEAAREIIRTFEFKSEAEGFDLRARIPELASEEGQSQSQYRVQLDVVAMDTNVEARPTIASGMMPFMGVTGAIFGLQFPDGQTATNKEPIILRIVSEADLLAEISKEEADLVDLLTRVVDELEDADRKLNRLTDVLPSVEGDSLLPESTRSAEINEIFSNSYNATQDVLTAYNRITREYRYNRCNESLINKVEKQVLEPLKLATDAQFPSLRESMREFNDPLQETPPRRPEPELSQQVVQQLRDLLATLRAVQEGIGEVSSIKKAIELLRLIDKRQSEVGLDITRLKGELQADLFAPKLVNVPAPVVNAGGTAKLELGIDFGLVFTGELELTFEGTPNSELTLPEPIRIDSENAELVGPTVVSFEIKAGTQKGQFPVRIKPAPEGKPVTMIVTVR